MAHMVDTNHAFVGGDKANDLLEIMSNARGE